MKRLRLTTKGVGLAALSLALAILSACSSAPSQAPAQNEKGFIITVRIGNADTQGTVVQKYGGEVLSWYPEMGLAHLKLGAKAYADLLSRGVSVQATSNGTLVSPEATAAGFSAWAGGFSAWAGGWSAWAGGTSIPSTPSANDAAFMQIRLPQAHAISRNFGSGVKVAVLDTGVDTTHPAIKNNLAAATEWRNFVSGGTNPAEVAGGNAYGHGTAAAGIILQVAPKATILPIRVLDSNGQGNLDNVIAGINHAVSMGARIINISLGSLDYYQPLADAINYAASKGVWVVASAGNQGKKDEVTMPGRWGWWLSNVIGVGSVDKDDKLSSFSSFGEDVYAWAPGEDIFTAYPGNQSTKAKGTSFAAPLYSGALALAYSETTNTTARSYLKSYLEQSLEGTYVWWNLYRPGSSWCTTASQWCHGAGRLDVERFLRSLPGFSPASNNKVIDLAGNGNFETGSASGWDTYGSTAVTSSNQMAGNYAAQINTTGGFQQTVTGLTPNTSYTLTAWLKADWSGEQIYLGVKNYGGTETATSVTGYTDWQKKSISFKTGASNTTALIYLWKGSGSGPAYGDLVTLTLK